MKLHILLDYKGPYYFEEGDVVVTSRYNPLNTKHTVKEVVFEYSSVYRNKKVIEEVNGFFKNTDIYFKPTRNTIYSKLLMAIYSFLDTVEVVIQEYGIQKIILYDGCVRPFVTTINAEGEGERKDYLTNWLVNAIIYERYKDSCKVEWCHRRSVMRFSIKNYLRWTKGIGFTILSSLIKSIINRGNSNEIINANIISIVDLPLQAYWLSNLLEETNRDIVFLTLGKECFKDLNNKGYHVSLVPDLSFIEILKLVSYSLFKSVSLSPTLFGKQFDKLLIREIRLQSLIYQIRYKRLCGFIDNSLDNCYDNILVTNNTWGIDVISAHEVAKRSSIKHFNFQYVGLGGILYPQLDLADYYYLYDRQTYDLYKKYNSTFHLYLPLVPKSIKEKNDRENRPLTLTIFMQPDSFVFDYFDYIESIIQDERIQQSGWKIIIKPHYRQNQMDKLISMVSGIPFVHIADPKESCADLLHNTDIAVSILSAVIFESLTNRVMCLVYNPKGKYDKYVYNYEVCYPEVNFVIRKPEETYSFMEGIMMYKAEYKKRLDKFVISNNIEVDINSVFLEK